MHDVESIYCCRKVIHYLSMLLDKQKCDLISVMGIMSVRKHLIYNNEIKCGVKVLFSQLCNAVTSAKNITYI